MSDWEGSGALVDACRYQRLRTVYALQRSFSPVAGSRHAPISSAAIYDSRQEFSIRDLQTEFLRALATIQKWRGLCQRAGRSSIIMMVANDIQRGQVEQGARVRWGGGRIKVFKDLELCDRHAEVCGGWKGEGECVSDPELVGVELSRAFEEA